jgi:hypothetical protein
MVQVGLATQFMTGSGRIAEGWVGKTGVPAVRFRTAGQN